MEDSAHPSYLAQPMPGTDDTSQEMPACIHAWGKCPCFDKANIKLMQ